MERDFFDEAPCSSIAVDSVIRMGTAGVIWGSCVGPFDANKLGLTGITRASFVAKLVGQYGLQWGAAFGAGTRNWKQVAGVTGLVCTLYHFADNSRSV